MNKQKEAYQNLYNSLVELGLTPNEISLYTTSLSLGPSSLTDLAKHLNVARPNLYKLIMGLENHKLAIFSDRPKHSRNFMVESPTIIKELLLKKTEHLHNLEKEVISSLPDLLALYRQGGLGTKIKIFENREQWMRAFYQILEEEKKQTEFMGSFDDWVKFVTWDQELKWIKKRVQKKIAIKLLFRPSEEAKVFEKDNTEAYREMKFLKDSLPFNCCIQLFANKAIIWQPATPLAILIEDSYIVDTLRSVFYLLWEHASVNTI